MFQWQHLQGVGQYVQEAGYHVQGAEQQMQGSGYHVQGAGQHQPNISGMQWPTGVAQVLSSRDLQLFLILFLPRQR